MGTKYFSQLKHNPNTYFVFLTHFLINCSSEIININGHEDVNVKHLNF